MVTEPRVSASGLRRNVKTCQAVHPTTPWTQPFAGKPTGKYILAARGIQPQPLGERNRKIYMTANTIVIEVGEASLAPALLEAPIADKVIQLPARQRIRIRNYTPADKQAIHRLCCET